MNEQTSPLPTEVGADTYRGGVFMKTFGCQMNEYDSERLETLAAQVGYLPTEKVTEAKLIIINTCSIREKAEQKLMGFLGRVKRMKNADPEVKICVSGCVAQQEGDRLRKRAPYIDLVLGTDQIDHFDDHMRALQTATPDMLDPSQPKPKHRTRVATQFHERKQAYNPETLPTGRKSFVSIMKGCNKMCSYCIVPFTRGREKSRPIPEVLNEVRFLISKGHKEVTLIGQNVNSYGKDLGRLQFAELLYKVHELPGLEGIRFTTSHPIDLSDDLIQAFADLPKLCSNFHLPVQSGSDRVLKEMRREYTIEWYMDRLEKLRAAREDLSISTDIIVGFPTETDADFQDTINLVRRVKYDSAYSFMYSPRPYTRAIKMEDNVPKEVKEARLQILQEEIRKSGLEINTQWVGRTVRGYIEGVSKHDPTKWTARSSQNKLVHFDPTLCASQPEKNSYIDLELTEARHSNFEGRPAAVWH